MPSFTWNQADLVECLGVVPRVPEHAVKHTFVVVREGLRLVLSVCQYDGDIEIALCRESAAGQYIFHTRLLGCPGVRFVRNTHGSDYLEFAPAKCFGDRYDGQSVIPYGIRITANTDICIELF